MGGRPARTARGMERNLFRHRLLVITEGCGERWRDGDADLGCNLFDRRFGVVVARCGGAGLGQAMLRLCLCLMFLAGDSEGLVHVERRGTPLFDSKWFK